MDLLAQALAGDRRALARALTLVENRAPGFRKLLRVAAGHPGPGHRVGVTGPPGVGKSTLASALAAEARSRNRTVAVLAVDPSSPFTGGALMGDRIRMIRHAGDSGVFVRSMASRGALGGLSAAAGEALDLLAAAGFDLLLAETVGAGQVDLDVAGEVETTVVVFAPGGGDAIQAMKSGLMEVADLWVVNKSDLARAEQVRADILGALALRSPSGSLEDRVLLVSAAGGQGIDRLLESLDRRLEELERTKRRQELRRSRVECRLQTALRERLSRLVEKAPARLRELVDLVLAGSITVHRAADLLMNDGLGEPPDEEADEP